MASRLLLWDIDGTILTAAGSGGSALLTAFGEVFGQTAEEAGIRFGEPGEEGALVLAGATDSGIAQRMLERVSIEVTSDSVQRLFEAYLEELARDLPKSPDARIFPGVAARLTEAADRPDTAQGLLTGNMARGAEIKLRHFDVWHFFEFGAFGDQHADRNKLGPIALESAEETLGLRFHPEQVIIIGDTPHDIACAEAFGARSLAVSTGSYDAARLREERADIVLESLEDQAAFWAAIDQLVPV